MNAPVRTTVGFGMLSALLVWPSTGLLAGFLGWTTAFDLMLWTCLACYQCSERCPSGVRYPEFVRACRSIAPKEVMESLCAHRGIPIALSRIMINPKIEQNRVGWLPEGPEYSKRGDLLYFVGCLPYFDVVFCKRI